MTNEELKDHFDLSNPYEIDKYIKAVKKATPVKAYLRGYLHANDLKNFNYYGDPSACVVLCELKQLQELLVLKQASITSCFIEHDRRNSGIPLLDITKVDACIEPGANIRVGVSIGKNCTIMMGASINIGAVIGEGTVVDMNAVIGAQSMIGKNTYIGPGAVITGISEPLSDSTVTIGNRVTIGANAVVLEGVSIGNGSTIIAGSIVNDDIPAGVVVAGSPGKIIKEKNQETSNNIELLTDLRG
jgi:2,3,4,5-tetrahydropyridine-2-carboxylate N-succinyltransferase